MTLQPLGLFLNFVGAVLLYRSATADETVAATRAGAAGADSGGESSAARGREGWIPDQDPAGLVRWFRSRSYGGLGWLLMAVGFALQILGYYLPEVRIVG